MEKACKKNYGSRDDSHNLPYVTLHGNRPFQIQYVLEISHILEIIINRIPKNERWLIQTSLEMKQKEKSGVPYAIVHKMYVGVLDFDNGRYSNL